MAYKQSDYSKKLLDPRWQKLRLEVMQANYFLCEECGDGESTLHIHHKEYFKGREPWEYDIKQLACICESCHKDHHSNDDFLKLVCSYAPLDGPANRSEIAFLIAAHLNFDYQTVLKASDYEDCPFTKAAYEAGNKIREILDELTKKHYQEFKKEKDNG